MGDDVSIDSKTLLVTDFVNLKIKPVQSFRYAYKDMMCVYIFIEISEHTCINIYACPMFLKNSMHPCHMQFHLAKLTTNKTVMMIQILCGLLILVS
jgi:hypothetical protein